MSKMNGYRILKKRVDWMELFLTDSNKIIYEMKTFAEDIPFPPPIAASAFTIVFNQQIQLPPKSSV
eukprot:7982733-Ditylum_brightwellii.AAC.1